jgi:membrane dipeptidase
MKFIDAHCDTIGQLLEGFDRFEGDVAEGPRLQVTLPGLQTAGVCCQVFASWVWSAKHRGREFEAAREMVAATRALCEAYPRELLLVRSGDEIETGCTQDGRTAVIAGLEGPDALQGDPRRMALFHAEGVRLLTMAWGDTPFCGSVFGDCSGLTAGGRELIRICEELGVVVDVSHVSDQGFADILRVADKPPVASHSSCRALCPNPRNLSDDMIRDLSNRGGVMGIALGSGFLSADFHAREKVGMEEFLRAIRSGDKTFEEARGARAQVAPDVWRPPLDLVVDHVRHAIDVGGEDCVGLGGDLDGVDSTPLGLDGIEDYPKIAEMLLASGVTQEQVEKVCWRNFARVFGELVR